MPTYYLVRDVLEGLSSNRRPGHLRFYVYTTREEADRRAGVFTVEGDSVENALSKLADRLNVPQSRVESVEDERPTD